jgi:hypothetical protein
VADSLPDTILALNSVHRLPGHKCPARVSIFISGGEVVLRDSGFGIPELMRILVGESWLCS